ncbi:MAG: hypothetical protein MI784_13070, partial [Cytophagales bacterium]|nr:hypothetical protein [Cytophagales bacterium]
SAPPPLGSEISGIWMAFVAGVSSPAGGLADAEGNAWPEWLGWPGRLDRSLVESVICAVLFTYIVPRTKKT